MQRLTSLFSFIGRLIHVDLEIQIESGCALAVSAEITLEMADAITENEAPYIWSDFHNCAIPVNALVFDSYDTDGIAGYRVIMPYKKLHNKMVWRDQIRSVALA